MYYNTLIVLIGSSLLGASAGVVGCFAVLRRRSLIGDALAHATLPGVCAAYLLLGERSMPVLLAGALLTGLLGIGVLAGLRRYTRIKEDAAIGLVRSVFYAVGIVLLLIVNKAADSGRSGLSSFIAGKTAGMVLEDVAWIAVLSTLTLVVVLLLYKELRLATFDPDFARVQGWPTFGLDFLALALMALVVVIGLPAAGVLLVAGLLVIPAAAARFWTEQFHWLLLLAGLFGWTCGICGTLVSANFDKVPAGPSIILVGVAIFGVSLVLGARRGLVARLLSPGLDDFSGDLER